jgi:hypothetical protein
LEHAQRAREQLRAGYGESFRALPAVGAPHVIAETDGTMICTVEEEAPVQNGYRYLTNRSDCLDYPRALALGLPIGSGMIESGHRQVLHTRLKKAGAAWLHETADQIAHLRILRANYQWQSLWN